MNLLNNQSLIISFVDTETTGLSQEGGHRIIEIAMILFDYNLITGVPKAVGKYVQGVNPNRSIDPKAQAVHGKSIDDLMSFPLWESVAPKVERFIKKTDLLVAHNAAFDVPFIANELVRVGRVMKDCEVFCTMQNGRFAKFDSTLPNLGKLAESLEVSYDKKMAHGAEYDTTVLAKCFFAGVKRGAFIIPA